MTSDVSFLSNPEWYVANEMPTTGCSQSRVPAKLRWGNAEERRTLGRKDTWDCSNPGAEALLLSTYIVSGGERERGGGAGTHQGL